MAQDDIQQKLKIVSQLQSNGSISADQAKAMTANITGGNAGTPLAQSPTPPPPATDQGTPEQIAKANALSDAYNQAKDAGAANTTTPDQFLADANAGMKQPPPGLGTHQPSSNIITGGTPGAPSWAMPKLIGNNVDPDTGVVKAQPVANPLTNGTADTSAVNKIAPQDPAALLRLMNQGKGGTSGPSALDKYIGSVKSETGEKLSTIDRLQQANLLDTSGQQQKNAFIGQNLADASNDAQTNSMIAQQRLQNSVDQANKLDADSRKQIDDLKAQQIDPNRLWHNMSTGDKVRTMISTVLGGFVYGWTGGKVNNIGLDHLNELIKQDTDAQMTDLANKKQSIHDQMALTQAGLTRETALHAAAAQSMLQKYQLTKDMISGEAAKYDNPTIQAAADRANAALDDKASDVRSGLATKIYEADSAKERAQAAAAAAQQARIQKIRDKASELVDKGVQPEEAVRTSVYLNTGINTDPTRDLATVEKPFEKAGQTKNQTPVNVMQADGTYKTMIARNPDELKQLNALSTLNSLAPNVTQGSTYADPRRYIQGTDAFDQSQFDNRWNAQVLGMVHAKNPAARSVEALNLIGHPYLVQPGDSLATKKLKVAAATKDFANTDMGDSSSATTATDKDADAAGFAAIK